MKLKSKMIYKVPVLLLFFLVSVCNSSFASAKCIYYKTLKIKSSDSGNVLSWTTSQEKDVRIFVIQKSTNGIDFRRIGDVRGSGFSKSKKSYRFLDLGATSSKTYYRLLHYASDGTFTVSKTFSFRKNSKSSWSYTPKCSPTKSEKVVKKNYQKLNSVAATFNFPILSNREFDLLLNSKAC